MVADTERLNGSKHLGRQARSVVDALNRHGDILAEGAVSLTAHSLVVHAGVDDTPLAAIAAAAVEIGVAGYYHSGLQALVVAVDLHNLGGKFVAWDAGIAEVGKGSAVGAKITAADAAVQHLEKGFSRFAHRLGDILNLHLAGLGDVDCFHDVPHKI